MPKQEDIHEQQKLLEVHRRTLGHYLMQLALHGAANIPPSIMHGISETREAIKRIKTILRNWNVEVEDYPDDFPSDVINWNNEALEAADILNSHHKEAHRGAILWRKGIVAIFENRNKENIEIYRERLQEENIEELSVRTSRRGGTTVILVRSEEARKLNDFIWEQLSISPGIASTQKSIAFRRIWQFFIDPLKDD